MTLFIGLEDFSQSSLQWYYEPTVNFPPGFVKLTRNRASVLADGDATGNFSTLIPQGGFLEWPAIYSAPWAFALNLLEVPSLLATILIEIKYDVLGDTLRIFFWNWGNNFINFFDDTNSISNIAVTFIEDAYDPLTTLDLNGFLGNGDILKTVQLVSSDTPDEVWAALSTRYSLGTQVTGGFIPILPQP